MKKLITFSLLALLALASLGAFAQKATATVTKLPKDSRKVEIVIVGTDTVKVTTTVSVQPTTYADLMREKEWKKQMYESSILQAENEKVRWKKDFDENDGLVNDYVKRRKPPVKN